MGRIPCCIGTPSSTCSSGGPPRPCSSPTGRPATRSSSKHARLDHTYEAEFRKPLTVDLLILDDFALDALDVQVPRRDDRGLVGRCG